MALVVVTIIMPPQAADSSIYAVSEVRYLRYLYRNYRTAVEPAQQAVYPVSIVGIGVWYQAGHFHFHFSAVFQRITY